MLPIRLLAPWCCIFMIGFLFALILPHTLTHAFSIVSSELCEEIGEDVCTIIFKKTTTGLTETVSTEWVSAMQSVTPTPTSNNNFAGCTINPTTKTLVISFKATSSFVTCSFIKKPTFLSIPGSNLPPISLSPISIKFTPTNESCADPQSSDECAGFLQLPVASFTLETTSFLQASQCGVYRTDGSPLSQASVSLSPIGSASQQNTVNFYTIVPNTTTAADKDAYISCDITLTKHFSRNHFVIKRNTKTLWVADNIVRYSVDISLSDGCYDPEDNVCIFYFTVPPLPGITTPNFTSIFEPNAFSRSFALPLLTSTDLVTGVQTFTQFILKHMDRPYKEPFLRLKLAKFSPADDLLTYNIPLSSPIAFTVPFLIDWDTDDCINPNTATCTATLSTHYVGGDVEVRFGAMPFSTMDSFECTNGISIHNLDHSVLLLSPVSTDKVLAATSKTDLLRSCKIKFALEYNFTTRPESAFQWILSAYKLSGQTIRVSKLLDTYPFATYPPFFDNLPFVIRPDPICYDETNSACVISLTFPATSLLFENSENMSNEEKTDLLSHGHLRNFSINLPDLQFFSSNSKAFGKHINVTTNSAFFYLEASLSTYDHFPNTPTVSIINITIVPILPGFPLTYDDYFKIPSMTASDLSISISYAMDPVDIPFSEAWAQGLTKNTHNRDIHLYTYNNLAIDTSVDGIHSTIVYKVPSDMVLMYFPGYSMKEDVERCRAKLYLFCYLYVSHLTEQDFSGHLLILTLTVPVSNIIGLDLPHSSKAIVDLRTELSTNYPNSFTYYISIDPSIISPRLDFEPISSDWRLAFIKRSPHSLSSIAINIADVQVIQKSTYDQILVLSFLHTHYISTEFTRDVDLQFDESCAIPTSPSCFTLLELHTGEMYPNEVVTRFQANFAANFISFSFDQCTGIENMDPIDAGKYLLLSLSPTLELTLHVADLNDNVVSPTHPMQMSAGASTISCRLTWWKVLQTGEHAYLRTKFFPSTIPSISHGVDFESSALIPFFSHFSNLNRIHFPKIEYFPLIIDYAENCLTPRSVGVKCAFIITANGSPNYPIHNSIGQLSLDIIFRHPVLQFTYTYISHVVQLCDSINLPENKQKRDYIAQTIAATNVALGGSMVHNIDFPTLTASFSGPIHLITDRSKVIGRYSQSLSFCEPDPQVIISVLMEEDFKRSSVTGEFLFSAIFDENNEGFQGGFNPYTKAAVLTDALTYKTQFNAGLNDGAENWPNNLMGTDTSIFPPMGFGTLFRVLPRFATVSSSRIVPTQFVLYAKNIEKIVINTYLGEYSKTVPLGCYDALVDDKITPDSSLLAQIITDPISQSSTFYPLVETTEEISCTVLLEVNARYPSAFFNIKHTTFFTNLNSTFYSYWSYPNRVTTATVIKVDRTGHTNAGTLSAVLSSVYIALLIGVFVQLLLF